MTPWLPLIGLSLYLLAVLATPTIGLAVVHGRQGLVLHRARSTAERALGLGFLLLIGGLVAWTILLGLWGPTALGVWALPDPARLLGWALLLGGTLLTAAAQWQMGASWRVGIDHDPTELVTCGLFRWMRNPIFTGMMLSLAGFTALCPAPLTVFMLLATVVLLPVQVRLEERHLLAQHGEAWAGYAARTGRFLPGLGRR